MDFLTQRLAHLLWQTEEKPSLEGMMDENARALARSCILANALDDFQCVEKIVLVLKNWAWTAATGTISAINARHGRAPPGR